MRTWFFMLQCRRASRRTWSSVDSARPLCFLNGTRPYCVCNDKTKWFEGGRCQTLEELRVCERKTSKGGDCENEICVAKEGKADCFNGKDFLDQLCPTEGEYSSSCG